MSKVRTGWWVTGCGVAAALGACSSAPTHIYGLDPIPAKPIDTYHAPPLRVDTLNVPAGWDRIEMLDLSAPGKLGISEFDHWSAPLAQIARQALSDDLDQRLPSGSLVYPRLPKPGSALGVDVDILEFGIAGDQASMRASWLIVPAIGSQSTKRSVALFRAPATSAGPAGVAHAWSAMIGQLSDRIAEDAASFATP